MTETPVTTRSATTGTLVILFAVLAALFAVALLVIPPAVPRDVWSYPLATTPFVIGQVFIGIHHLVLAIGLLTVWRTGLAGRSRLATVGAVSSVSVMIAFAVVEVVAAGAADNVGPTAFVGVLGGLYGVLTVLLAVASILFGVAILRARNWTGITRWTVLITGIYLLVPMVPAQLDPLFWGRLALALWSLLYVGLGIALRRSTP
jgi:hypothetical protein